MDANDDVMERIFNKIKMNISDSMLNETLRRLIEIGGFGHDPSMHPEECHEWTYVLDIFNWYYVPILSLCGLIGNMLSYLVFLNTYLKMRSSSYYLAALSAADFGFLISISLVWINNKLDIPVFNREGWCQFMIYLSSVCSFLSVWLIVAFTVERFIAVQYPLHRPHMCTISRAKCIVTVLIGVALLIYSYTFFTAGIIHNGECELRETYHEMMRVINIVDTLLTLIIPVGLIIIMNAMIAKNLFQFSKHFRRHNGATFSRSDTQLCPTVLQSSSSNDNAPRRTVAIRMSAIGNEGSLHTSYSECRPTHFHKFPNVTHTPTQNSCQSSTARCVHVQVSCGNLMSTRTQQNITKMLLLVSTVFVSLNFPSYLIRLYIFFRFSIWQAEAPARYLWCAQQMFMLLYYTNFSINFLLYSMCGITFRRCLFQLLRNFFKRLTSFRCVSVT